MPRCATHPHIELEPRRKGWRCPDCDDVVVTYDEVPRGPATLGVTPSVPPDAALVALTGQLPALLAIPLSAYTNEGRPVLRLWNACDFVELTLRLLVLLGVGHLRMRGPLSEQV